MCEDRGRCTYQTSRGMARISGCRSVRVHWRIVVRRSTQLRRTACLPWSKARSQENSIQSDRHAPTWQIATLTLTLPEMHSLILICAPAKVIE